MQPQPNISIHGTNDPFPPMPTTSTPRNIPHGNGRAPNFNSVSDTNFYVQMINKICITLQEGLENPEDYLNALNITNTSYGLPAIIIPNEQLILARNKFLSKLNATNAFPPPLTIKACLMAPTALLPPACQITQNPKPTYATQHAQCHQPPYPLYPSPQHD